ncbi:MAG: DivIVA domain-containing protein [Oscillospiraceae bacterium]|nr:DivIVA domain-containing protein [Oscillospiraceae bacterium]
MFTPQQIEQISFGRQTFGGYDMQSVDAFLEPLTEDYITLYKENALLKSKMRVLVSKLEEYRKNEASMKDAMVNAQKTCDMMVKEAETKCAQMLSDANATAAENSKNADSLIAQENARVEEARQAASVKIQEIEDQLQACIQALTRIREANRPVAPTAAPASGNNAFFDYDSDPDNVETVDPTDAVANEISSNLEALVGTTEEAAPKAEPKHPTNDTTTSKFANLQFGRNYDPNHK